LEIHEPGERAPIPGKLRILVLQKGLTAKNRRRGILRTRSLFNRGTQGPGGGCCGGEKSWTNSGDYVGKEREEDILDLGMGEADKYALTEKDRDFLGRPMPEGSAPKRRNCQKTLASRWVDRPENLSQRWGARG